MTAFNFAAGQNLIDNPDFELAGAEPKAWIDGDNNFTCTGWTSPSSHGTPDYYTTKRTGDFSARAGSRINRKPFSGEAFVGMVIDADSDFGSLCEYIQTRLNQKLVKDNYYCLTLYTSPDEWRGYSTNELDYFFTPGKFEIKDDFITPAGYGKLTGTSGFFEPKAWSRVSSCYLAKGNEEYLTIGMCNTKCRRVSFDLNQLKYWGFYLLIDNVSLVPVTDTAVCECNKIVVIKDVYAKYAQALDKPLALKNINFETNKAQLMPGSEKELKLLAGFLAVNPSYKIEITGHTDNVGKEAENSKLSKSRAASVADFLMNAGIAKNRISFKGMGSKVPLKPNDTDENRRLNRRVEFRVSR